MLLLRDWYLVAVVVIIAAVFYLIVHELMRPWVMQRRREGKCEHDFQGFTQEHAGRVIFHVFFCGKCGGRRLGGTDIQVGVVEKRIGKKGSKP